MHETHDGRVVFRCNNLFGDVGNVLKLRSGFIRLRDVHVHLITIEIGVIRRADREIEAEGIIGKNSDAVTHHTHTMECRLSIKQHIISVLECSFHNCSVVYYL